MRRCQTCNDYFDELGAWQKICKPCFAKSKQAERARTDERADELDSEKTKLTVQNSALIQRIHELEDQLYILKKNNNNNVFTPDLLKKIRMLVHPDKHNNSELSLNVSKTLNSLIKRAQS